MLVGWWDLGANGNNKTYYFAKDGLMVSGKWLEIDGKWYYFNTDGSLTRSTKIYGYEVDENGV
jgi:glucan-binding YG repeat protein